MFLSKLFEKKIFKQLFLSMKIKKIKNTNYFPSKIKIGTLHIINSKSANINLKTVLSRQRRHIKIKKIMYVHY